MEELITKSLCLFKNTCPGYPISIPDDVSKKWYSDFWNGLMTEFKEEDPSRISFHDIWNSIVTQHEKIVGRSMVDQKYRTTKKLPSKEMMAKIHKKRWYQKMEYLFGVKFANKMILSAETDKEKEFFVSMVEAAMSKFRGNVGEQLIEFFSRKNLFSFLYKNYVPLVDDIYEMYIDAKAETTFGTPIGIQIKNYDWSGAKFETFVKVWSRITGDLSDEFGLSEMSIEEIKKNTHGLVVSINTDGYNDNNKMKDTIKQWFGNAIGFVGPKELEPILTPSNQHRMEMFEEIAKIFEV